ncbi:MAG TPA: IS4 family transposase [Clostridia bacterium]|nr:IS4 family transposase [Clostridia bacterium]
MEDQNGNKLFDGHDGWALMEVGQTELGDERRTKRLVRVVSALAANPTCSMPEAFESWTDIKAAYRFFENDDVEPAAILGGHRLSTLRRMSKYPVVLAIQDTTTVNFSGLKATKRLGSIGAKRGLQKEDPQGFFVHSCLTATLEGVPLGLLAQKQWVRGGEESDSEEGENSGAGQTGRAAVESARWTEMVEASVMGLPPGTRVIHVADREADIYDVFAKVLELNQDALVRAKHNRHLAGGAGRLWDVLDAGEVVGSITVEVQRADNRPSRTAILQLRITSVRVPSPKWGKTLTLSAVLAREIAPPEGVEPIEWRLLTTLAVISFEDACHCVGLYTKRWLIERFHYTLKSGCQVEELQLETAERLQRAVSVYSVVAWRLLYLTYRARVSPEVPCTGFLSESEWQALYCKIHRTRVVPSQPPTLEAAILMIARMGGFLARKGDGKPGVQVIWKGYRRLQDLVVMWEILRA